MNADRLVYVYCLARPEVKPALGGLAGLEPDSPPYALDAGSMVAVASDVPAESYAQGALASRLADGEWLSARGLAHERVVESCFLVAPTIPLRFGTIFHAPERVVAFVESRGPELETLLGELSGKVEWDVRVFVDRPRFEAAAAKRLSTAPSAPSGPGRAYLEAKRAAAAARESAREAIARAAGEVEAHLSAASLATARAPESGEGSLVLRSTFLVAWDLRANFEAAIARERERLELAGFRIEATGPWPPYSFASMAPPAESTR